MIAPAKKSDPQIQQDVLRELEWDPRVEATDVGVEVDHGVVTLTGTVSNWAKRHAAQEAAHQVAGVLDVANNIEVKVPNSPGVTDTDIARTVREALTWDVLVPDQRIRSTVAEGVVTLEGTVDFLSEREDAERAIRHLAGVRRVIDNISVLGPRVAATPATVREAIEAALARRAQREAHRIHVEVVGGQVTLSGRVRSWEEKRAVLGAAGYTGGVEVVDDRLTIDPHA
jgi:osmotically-inducible protein OsmY